MITGCHFTQVALRVLRVGMGPAAVDRVAVGRPTDLEHPLAVSAEAFDESGGKGVVVIGPVRLDVGIVFVEPEVEEAGGSLITPAGAAVIVPRLGCAGFERHTVDRHAPPPTAAAFGSGGSLGLQWHAERVALGCRGVGIATTRKGTGLVVRPAVRLDDAELPFGGDADRAFDLQVCRGRHQLEKVGGWPRGVTIINVIRMRQGRSC